MKKFKQFIAESSITLYRGTSKDNTEKYIEWYSVDKEQALGYSKHRIDSKLITKDLNFNRVIDFGKDTLHIKPKTLASKAFQGADKSKININDAKNMLKELEEYFGDKDIPVIDYWQDSDSKKVIHKFLKFFSYNAIKITEDGFDTYGVLL